MSRRTSVLINNPASDRHFSDILITCCFQLKIGSFNRQACPSEHARMLALTEEISRHFKDKQRMCRLIIPLERSGSYHNLMIKA